MRTQTPSEPVVITFPQEFKASRAYQWSLGAGAAIGMLTLGLMLARHAYSPAAVLVVPTISCFGLFMALVSLRMQADEKGIHQAWLLGRGSITWAQIQRLEKSRRSYFVLDSDQKERVKIAFLSQPEQEALALEIIRRSRLRKAKAAPKYPITDIWERKK